MFVKTTKVRMPFLPTGGLTDSTPTNSQKLASVALEIRVNSCTTEEHVRPLGLVRLRPEPI